MGTAGRASRGADRCFVWLTTPDGTMLGVPVDGAGDEREQAGRAWLHFLARPNCHPFLAAAEAFEVLADGRRRTVAFTKMREWLELPGGSPREVVLKQRVREARSANLSISAN